MDIDGAAVGELRAVGGVYCKQIEPVRTAFADRTAPESSPCRVKSKQATACPRPRNQAAGETNPKGCRPNSYVEISTIFIAIPVYVSPNIHVAMTDLLQQTLLSPSGAAQVSPARKAGT